MRFDPLLLLQATPGPDGSSFANGVLAGVQWLRLAAEIAGAAMVAIGVLMALIGFARALAARHAAAFTDVRLTLGRYLTLALEFQLAADILSTSVAPSWDQLGKLAATAVIRTALNYFLTKELREAGERVTTEHDSRDPTGAPRSPA